MQLSFGLVVVFAVLLVVSLGVWRLVSAIRERRQHMDAEVLREHPELVEIAASAWNP
jgi:ABC-type nickel/cobalt efflux system permease component RcnA